MFHVITNFTGPTYYLRNTIWTARRFDRSGCSLLSPSLPLNASTRDQRAVILEPQKLRPYALRLTDRGGKKGGRTSAVRVFLVEYFRNAV